MTEKDFIELKVQLARIEENVSQLPELKSEVKHLNMTLGETNARSLQNERDIARMQNNMTWLSRSVISIVIGLVVTGIFTLV